MLLTFCPYDLFLSLLLGAEYVFYWNVLSNSIINRLANRLPVFLFHRGHFAWIFNGMGEKGFRHYHQGVELPLLDQYQTLSATVLTPLAREHDLAMEATRNNWRRAPTPEKVVESLLADQEPREKA